MAETKDFTCRACGAQFDTRDSLDQHNRREHGAQSQGGQQGNRGTDTPERDQGYGESGSQRDQGGRGTGSNEPGSSGTKRAGESSAWEEEDV